MATVKTVFSNEEAARLGFTHKFTIKQADMTSATPLTLMALTGATAPPNFGLYVTKVAIRLVTAFNSVTTDTLSVGDTALGTQYINAFDVRGTVPGTTGYQVAAASTAKVYTATSQNLTATWTQTGGAGTAGVADIYVHIARLDSGADSLPQV